MKKRSYSFTVCERWEKEGRYTVDCQPDGTYRLYLNGEFVSSHATCKSAKDHAEDVHADTVQWRQLSKTDHSNGKGKS